MPRLKKYAYGSSSHQSSGIIMERMQQEIHLGKSNGKAKSKVQHSVKAKMKVEDSYTVQIKRSTKVEMAGTIFQPSFKIEEEKMEMIQYSKSSGHTNRNVGRLMLPSLEISSTTAHDSDRKRKRVEITKGQGIKNTRPVKKSGSNQRSGSCTCRTTKRTATKKTARKEQKSTETRSSTQLSCTYGDVFVEDLSDDDDDDDDYAFYY